MKKSEKLKEELKSQVKKRASIQNILIKADTEIQETKLQIMKAEDQEG